MILMADMRDGSSDGASFSGRQGGNITHPFISQTYRCIAAYETKDTKNRPFKVDVDENVDVLIKDPAGQPSTEIKFWSHPPENTFDKCNIKLNPNSHSFTVVLIFVGWWFVENEEKRLAWFPAPYLELLDGEDDDEGFQPGGELFHILAFFKNRS